MATPCSGKFQLIKVSNIISLTTRNFVNSESELSENVGNTIMTKPAKAGP